MPKPEPFARLFDELHHADQDVEQAQDALDVAFKAQRRVRQQIWAALDASIDAQAGAATLRETIEKLQTMILELTARLPPPPEGGR